MIKKYIRNVIVVLALVGGMWLVNTVLFYSIYPKRVSFLFEAFPNPYTRLVVDYVCGMLSAGLLGLLFGIAFRIKPLTALLSALVFMLGEYILLVMHPSLSGQFMMRSFLYLFFTVLGAGLAYIMVMLGSNIRNKVSTKG